MKKIVFILLISLIIFSTLLAAQSKLLHNHDIILSNSSNSNLLSNHQYLQIIDSDTMTKTNVSLYFIKNSISCYYQNDAIAIHILATIYKNKNVTKILVVNEIMQNGQKAHIKYHIKLPVVQKSIKIYDLTYLRQQGFVITEIIDIINQYKFIISHIIKKHQALRLQTLVKPLMHICQHLFHPKSANKKTFVLRRQRDEHEMVNLGQHLMCRKCGDVVIIGSCYKNHDIKVIGHWIMCCKCGSITFGKVCDNQHDIKLIGNWPMCRKCGATVFKKECNRNHNIKQNSDGWEQCSKCGTMKFSRPCIDEKK